MKFKDNLTGLTLDTENLFVIGQYKKHIDRYTEVKQKQGKPNKK